jgi:hypothetical protein
MQRVFLSVEISRRGNQKMRRWDYLVSNPQAAKEWKGKKEAEILFDQFVSRRSEIVAAYWNIVKY